MHDSHQAPSAMMPAILPYGDGVRELADGDGHAALDPRVKSSRLARRFSALHVAQVGQAGRCREGRRGQKEWRQRNDSSHRADMWRMSLSDAPIAPKLTPLQRLADPFINAEQRKIGDKGWMEIPSLCLFGCFGCSPGASAKKLCASLPLSSFCFIYCAHVSI